MNPAKADESSQRPHAWRHDLMRPEMRGQGILTQGERLLVCTKPATCSNSEGKKPEMYLTFNSRWIGEVACAPLDIPSSEDGTVGGGEHIRDGQIRFSGLSRSNEVGETLLLATRSDPKKPLQGAHSGVLNPPAYGGDDEKRNDRGLPKQCKVGDALTPYWGTGAPGRTRQKVGSRARQSQRQRSGSRRGKPSPSPREI